MGGGDMRSGGRADEVAEEVEKPRSYTPPQIFFQFENLF